MSASRPNRPVIRLSSCSMAAICPPSLPTPSLFTNKLGKISTPLDAHPMAAPPVPVAPVAAPPVIAPAGVLAPVALCVSTTPVVSAAHALDPGAIPTPAPVAPLAQDRKQVASVTLSRMQDHAHAPGQMTAAADANHMVPIAKAKAASPSSDNDGAYRMVLMRAGPQVNYVDVGTTMSRDDYNVIQEQMEAVVYHDVGTETCHF
ncbi:hypothetical protein F5Y16DRAFT_268563 [Xylariaceae sp. FL0255]|nr:hypothetical protein F5Y16DRAFT_268563 [Xylariaceae sp. FL0255]